MPVKAFLVPGNNSLTFRISPAVEAAQQRAAAYPYPVPSLCEPRGGYKALQTARDRLAQHHMPHVQHALHCRGKHLAHARQLCKAHASRHAVRLLSSARSVRRWNLSCMQAMQLVCWAASLRL